MQEAKYLKSCGLTAEHGELLLALFQSGFESSPVPAWVSSSGSALMALDALRRAGLVDEHPRLTMAGLVVAAGLARVVSDRIQGRSRLPRAA